MTSANAAHALAAHPQAALLRPLPVFAVGDRTAEAARAAGFTDVASANGALADLARLVAERCAGARAPLLYAAGEDRAGDLSSPLGAHGIAVRTVAVYRAVAETTLPSRVAELLRRGEFDGVLHYSRRSLAIFLRLSEQASLLNAALGVVHYCLSAEVAAPLEEMGARRIKVAAAPNEAALFKLLDTD
jgi:uroporphyrinogen-III synthase